MRNIRKVSHTANNHFDRLLWVSCQNAIKEMVLREVHFDQCVCKAGSHYNSAGNTFSSRQIVPTSQT